MLKASILQSSPSPRQGRGTARRDLVERLLELLAGLDGNARLAAGRRVCALLVTRLWQERTGDSTWFEPWPAGPAPRWFPSFEVRRLIPDLVDSFEGESTADAAYHVGRVYTALLPRDVRAELGAYYTPPTLSERLLDMAAAAGTDWSQAKVLDPACGGGAFLAPVASRILSHHRVQAMSAAERLAHLEGHLSGIEIDPFAAWLTRAFLRLETQDLARAAGRPLQPDVRVGDALEVVLQDRQRFDLVIGNPPYGRLQLSDRARTSFARSLYGHANLYGLFLDAALRWRSERGLVAFVTPTSFLGGRYFSRLRNLLLDEAPPLSLDFVDARKGVFDSVLQETCLAVFGPSHPSSVLVHALHASERTAKIERIGATSLEGQRNRPWLVPRTSGQAALIEGARRLPTRLVHLGLQACTGPLVWNRHKSQLRDGAGLGRLPLIWAEAIRPNAFSFEYRTRARAPFVELEDDQDFLCTRSPAVLVQRTTAKEQDRRLVACAVPPSFLDEWGAMVVENHVNVIAESRRSSVALPALAAVLNTRTIDQLFRCLSGSVAVSVTELHALPLPPPECFDRVAKILDACPEAERQTAVDEVVRSFYLAGATGEP